MEASLHDSLAHDHSQQISALQSQNAVLTAENGLLKQQVDPNVAVRVEWREFATTPLVEAAVSGHTRVARMLLASGARVETSVGPGIGLQGLVLFALYLAGIVGALVVALVLRNTLAKGAASGFIMEMPRYQLPRIKDTRSLNWSTCGS